MPRGPRQSGYWFVSAQPDVGPIGAGHEAMASGLRVAMDGLACRNAGRRRNVEEERADWRATCIWPSSWEQRRPISPGIR